MDGVWSNVDRPTMRYEIFRYTPERGQWKWSEARASKAIRNYDVYKRKFYPSPWTSTGEDREKKEFIRKRDGVKYPEYWIPKRLIKYLIIFGQILNPMTIQLVMDRKTCGAVGKDN